MHVQCGTGCTENIHFIMTVGVGVYEAYVCRGREETAKGTCRTERSAKTNVLAVCGFVCITIHVCCLGDAISSNLGELLPVWLLNVTL